MRRFHKLRSHIRHGRKVFNEHKFLNRITLILSYLLFFYMIFRFAINTNVLFSKSGFSALIPTPTPSAEQVSINMQSNEILVKVKKTSRTKVRTGTSGSRGIKSLDTITQNRKAKRFERVITDNKGSTDSNIFSWYVLTFDEPAEKLTATYDKKTKRVTGNTKVTEIETTIDQIRQDSDIETAEPNYIVTADALDSPYTPNDPYFSSRGSWYQTFDDQWGVKKIKTPYVWQSAGLLPIVVASIDSGVDRNHPDLANKMWVNTKEIPNNGIDDDKNGYIDDYYGWDYANNDNDPLDDFGHGTMTAGIIAGELNNGIGIAGIAPSARIMALKFFDSRGSGTIDKAAQAIKYAADNGARVSNNSWGCGGTVSCITTFMQDTFDYAYNKGQTIVASAGNSALGYTSLILPAGSEKVITVGASTSNDSIATYSNFGAKIDVVAPGTDILSTKSTTDAMCTNAIIVGNKYCVASGTSFAAPHVAGVLALLLSINPTLLPEQLRQIIRTSAQDLGTPGRDMTFGYGLLNAQAAVALAQNPPPLPIITNLRTHQIVTSPQLTIMGSASGVNIKEYRIEVGRQAGDWKVDTSDDYGLYPQSFTVVKTSTSPVASGTLGTIDMNQFGNGLYTIRLVVKDQENREYFYEVMDIIAENYAVPTSTPPAITSTPVITPIITTTPTPKLVCNGQCKGDPYGTSYPAGFSCYGVDNVCYQCGTSGYFSRSNTCTATPTIVQPTSASSCKGQCKGDQLNTSYSVGHACYGMDNLCYVCNSNGNFSVSSTACVSTPTPSSTNAPTSTIKPSSTPTTTPTNTPTLIPTPTSNVKCLGQCQGDLYGSYYPQGKICWGIDNQCYTCGSNGNFSKTAGACSAIPTPTPQTNITCIGQCKGDPISRYQLGHACYGNDTICYVCGSNGNFSVSQTACISQSP